MHSVSKYSCPHCREEDYSRWQKEGCFCEDGLDGRFVWIFLLAIVSLFLLLIMFSCSQIPSKIGNAVADEVVHDTRSFLGLEKRVDLLEKDNDHLKTDMELTKNSHNYTNKVMDGRLERIETLLDKKMDRMIELEESILRLLKKQKKLGML